MPGSSFWCAVQVAPRHEMKVSRILASKGYEEFTPTYRARRKWSDRYKILELPLFPGYVFCRIQKETARVVFKTVGVVRIVSFGGEICPIDDHEIEALQRVASSGRDVSPSSYLKTGQRMQILSGPLAGITGILRMIRNSRELVISVDMLMRSVSVSIDASEATPVSTQSNGSPGNMLNGVVPSPLVRVP
jgi:transcription antitermination factor NusG